MISSFIVGSITLPNASVPPSIAMAGICANGIAIVVIIEIANIIPFLNIDILVSSAFSLFQTIIRCQPI